MRAIALRRLLRIVALFGCATAAHAQAPPPAPQAGAPARAEYDFDDSHFHLTNYIQRGTELSAFLDIMGTRVGRVALFGIPLQQQWSARIDGDHGPTYYLNTDAPLYYYSFTDAQIAMAYLALPAPQRERFDPMITGFNPTDMYAVDHIRRVLTLFPGVFTGIGEFTIHKEFVAAKVAGGTASLLDPALDSILTFAGRVGLLVILHNDVDVPFAKAGAAPAYLGQVRRLFARHPETTIIWAHTGVGRVVRPIAQHGKMLEAILTDPQLSHVNFDLSWDEVAKYIVANDTSIRLAADLVNRFPDRFLFGTDVVAPADPQQYYRIYDIYRPFLDRLTPDARAMLLRKNYERLFGAARSRVRLWEAANVRRASQPLDSR
ncbi:MAG TPA: amidohydrolase family protein [Gemmatimonadaceae bacterium]|nr:amidohydrolase family protein [Gemmatimonadaceae bacterium]